MGLHSSKGVTFHDGSPLTASGIVFSLTEPNPDLDFKEYIDGVTSVGLVRMR